MADIQRVMQNTSIIIRQLELDQTKLGNTVAIAIMRRGVHSDAQLVGLRQAISRQAAQLRELTEELENALDDALKMEAS